MIQKCSDPLQWSAKSLPHIGSREILSPLRLPIPPPGQEDRVTITCSGGVRETPAWQCLRYSNRKRGAKCALAAWTPPPHAVATFCDSNRGVAFAQTGRSL